MPESLGEKESESDKGERNAPRLSATSASRGCKYAGEGNVREGIRDVKEVRIITDCLLFSAFCFYAFLALGAVICLSHYGPSRFRVEIGSLSLFHPRRLLER